MRRKVSPGPGSIVHVHTFVLHRKLERTTHWRRGYLPVASAGSGGAESRSESYSSLASAAARSAISACNSCICSWIEPARAVRLGENDGGGKKRFRTLASHAGHLVPTRDARCVFFLDRRGKFELWL